MKFNIKSGITGKLVGGIIGGAGNALYDSYVKPMLPDTLADSGEYVKIAIGAALPALVKNDIVEGIGNGLLTVGCSNVIASLLEAKSDNNSGGGDTAKTSGVNPARIMVGRTPNFRGYIRSAQRRVSGVAADPAKAMVNGTKVVC